VELRVRHGRGGRFIDRLQATVDGRPVDSPVTAEDARTVQFSSVWFREGYDMEQVDLFLEQVQELLGPTG
jgi:DivIVA domain-containing protein